MAIGSSSETFATLGGGGAPRRVGLRNQMMRSDYTLQPLAGGPKLTTMKCMIKRQAYNE